MEMEEHLLGEEPDRSWPSKKQTSLWGGVRIHIIIFLLYSTLAIITVSVYQYVWAHPPSQSAAFWPSPAMDAVSYEQVQFNGTLTFPSPYKGPPTPEVEDLWDRVTMLPPFGISEDVVVGLGKDPAHAAKMPSEFGDQYLASTEVVHQLHCLNLLRQHTYYDYYHDIIFKHMGTQEQQQLHLDHCIDLLRQALTCQADTGLITYAWVAFADTPMPDFNTMHECRNFEDIRNWVVDQAPAQHIDHRKPKDGAFVWGNIP